MKVIVFGSTGKLGELVWRGAISAGHDVTIFGRSVSSKYPDESVTKFQGDVLDKSSVSRAISGHDAVLVCLGPIGLRDTTTLSEGSRNICDSMRACGVNRVIFISAAGVGASWRYIPWYSKLLFSTLLRVILSQHTIQESIFSASGLNWTAVRAAVLTNSLVRRGFTASDTSPTRTISRLDLSDFLIDCLSTDTYDNCAISVTSK